MRRPLFGIDELRHAVATFNACREDFNHRYSAEELLKLYRALQRSEWDILPDDWTRCELRNALSASPRAPFGAKQEERECSCKVCVRK